MRESTITEILSALPRPITVDIGGESHRVATFSKLGRPGSLICVNPIYNKVALVEKNIITVPGRHDRTGLPSNVAEATELNLILTDWQLYDGSPTSFQSVLEEARRISKAGTKLEILDDLKFLKEMERLAGEWNYSVALNKTPAMHTIRERSESALAAFLPEELGFLVVQF